MKLKIEITMDNAAFEGAAGAEAARILEEYAGEIRNCRTGGDIKHCATKLRDYNGNVVGTVTVMGR